MALALKLTTCLVVTMCIVAYSVDATITCGTMATTLAPCGSYLANGGVIPEPCCDGIKKLNDMEQTTQDRQQACKCVKSATQGINPSLASSLPGKCGLTIPYPISINTNCDIVK